MITVDASMVIAHLQPRDPHHRAAATYLREHAGETLFIHSLNLAEVLVGGVKAGRGLEMLGDLQAIGIRVVDPADGEPLRLAALRAESGLKLPGCCALHTALVSGSVLATLDEDLTRAAHKRHLTVAPAAQATPAPDGLASLP